MQKTTIYTIIAFVFLSAAMLFSQNPSDDMELIHYRLGMRHYKAKEYTKAVEAFNRMLTFRPGHAPSHHMLGLCYLEQKDIPQAISSLRKAARFDGENTDVLKALADGYAANNEKEKAMAQLRLAIDKEKNSDKKSKFEKDMAMLLGAVKSQQATTSKTAYSAKTADSIVVAAPSAQSKPQPFMSKDTLLVRAAKLIADSSYQEALKETRFLLTKHPGKPGAYYYAALARLGLKQTKEALYNFKRVVADPQFGKSASEYVSLLETAAPLKDVKKGLNTTVKAKSEKVDSSKMAAVDTAKTIAPVSTQFVFPITDKLNFVIEDTSAKDGQRMLAALDLYLAERPDPAINQLRSIYQTSPRSKEADNALYNLGLIYAKLRLWDNAVPFLSKVNKEYPGSDVAAASAALLGHSYAGRGDADSAFAVFDRFIAKYPGNSKSLEVISAKGDLLFSQGKWPAAQSVYAAGLAIAATPSSKIEMNQKIGECFWKQSESAKAVEYLKVAAADSTSTTESAQRAVFRLADAYFKIKNFENALRFYRQAIARFPSSTDVPWALYQMGNIHRRGGQADAAIKVYDRLIGEYPGSYWASQAKWQRDDVVWENDYKEILR
ncbi:MAG: tetratricopeptide repeat protein [Fibrobacteres bacterium]|nr:tetratricopeptide repeat protein [Fibrobacterota bacterium]